MFKFNVTESSKPIVSNTNLNDKEKASNNNIKSGALAEKIEKKVNENFDKKIGSANVIKGSGDKRITIKNIAGKFTKDFDIVGKMDVFLRFFLGLESLETE